MATRIEKPVAGETYWDSEGDRCTVEFISRRGDAFGYYEDVNCPSNWRASDGTWPLYATDPTKPEPAPIDLAEARQRWEQCQELHELFEKHNDEFLKFDRIENKRSKRPDLHAFLRLDSLFPGNRDMVSAAEHDEIYLDVPPDDLAAIASDDLVIELTRCGVRYDVSTDSLCMFV